MGMHLGRQSALQQKNLFEHLVTDSGVVKPQHLGCFKIANRMARLIEWIKLRVSPPGRTGITPTESPGKFVKRGRFSNIMAAVYNKLDFDFIRDIVPVAGFTREPLVMTVRPSLPTNSLREFITYAKANPGKINMASPGNGSSGHVAANSSR